MTSPLGPICSPTKRASLGWRSGFHLLTGTLRVVVRSITIGPASRGRKEFPRPVCQREPRCVALGFLAPLYSPDEQPSRAESTDGRGDRRQRYTAPTQPGIQTECVVLEGLLQHRFNNLFFERHARVVHVRRPGSLVGAIPLTIPTRLFERYGWAPFLQYAVSLRHRRQKARMGDGQVTARPASGAVGTLPV